MKNLTKILMAVVCGILALSCVTDTTEDLSVSYGAEQTIINLSLEETRTHIGAKSGEEYPLYWSEGDKIAVNGIASQPLGSSYHGEQNAQFTIEATLSYPHNIVYPAPAEGVVAAEGKQVVTFQETQNYTAGTFASGASPMYALVESNNDAISLKHLAGVLRIAPKGDGETLVAMDITAESGMLAGNFDIDCSTGKLTPQASATNTVSVLFGEKGLTLGAEEMPIYVGVPAGEYGDISVTLYTATDSMNVHFNTSGSRRIKAGMVREFAPFTYNGSGAASDTFLIYDEASLRLFAEKAADFAPYTRAKMTANIDMTGKEWSPVHGFGEYEFDGGNHSIKGLTAPLFDTTSTSIKNIRLIDIDMTVTGADAGALAWGIKSANAVVENCYVSGKFTIDAAQPTPIYDTNLQYGGIIGHSVSEQTFSNLTADVELIAKGSFSNFQTRIAGVIGSHKGKLTNSTNLGSITFAATIEETPIIGGVTYLALNGMDNCHNKGDIIIKEATISNNLLVAGVSGQIGKSVTNCNNYGNISIDIDFTGSIFAAGWVARSHSVVTASKCYNYGKIEVSGNAASLRIGGLITEDFSDNMTVTDSHNYGDIIIKDVTTTADSYIGGLFGIKNDSIEINHTNCSNNGDIVVNKGCTLATNSYIGGLLGVSSAKGGSIIFTSCTNNGKIDVEEGVNISNIYAGGIVGYKSGVGLITIENATNKGAVIYNATGTGILQIAGVIGSYASNNATLTLKKTVTNEGVITIGGTAKGNVRIGGVIGAFAPTLHGDSVGATIWNKGDMNISLNNGASYSATSFLVGGIVGAMSQASSSLTIYNEGNITVTSSNCHVGGIAGSQAGSGTKTVINAQCFCNLKATNAKGAGMLTGAARSKLMQQCNFGGSIQKSGMSEPLTLNIDNFHTYAYNSEESRETIVTTDVIGYITSINDNPKYNVPTKIGTVEELRSFLANNTTGDILLTADLDMTNEDWTPIVNYTGNFDGGNNKIIGLKAPLFGETTNVVCLQNIHIVDADLTLVDGNGFHFGALACHLDNVSSIVNNCSASGTININITTANTDNYFVGGLVGRTTTSKTLSNLENNINIASNGNVFAIYIGGCVGSAPYAIVDNSRNYGTITLDGRYGGSQLIGGVVATCAGVTNCTNGSDKEGEKQLLGKITYNGEHYGTATRYIDLAGVCAFTNAEATVASGCKNYGSILAGGSVISGSKTMLRVGGVFTNGERIGNGAITNCQNYGNIIVTHDNPGAQNAMISGICSLVHDGLLLNELSNLHNYGNITVSKEASFSKNVLLGGISNVFDYPRVYKDLYNHGNITVEEINIGGELQLGGITGRLKAGAIGSTGRFGNEGKINVAATVASATCIGGIIGNLQNIDIDAELINIGDLNITGTFNGNTFIGGVAGGSSKAGNVYNAKCHCNLYSNGLPAGFIIGTDRSDTSKAINCAVGGKFVSSWDYSDVYPTALGEELTPDNYFYFIYRTTYNLEEIGHDGCTFLTTKPTLQ